MTPQAKTAVIAGVVILALAIGAFIYFTPPAAAPSPTDNPSGMTATPSPTATPTPTPSPSVPATTGTPTPKPSGITMAQVAAHASASSCWSVIRGTVYDLTSWIGKHPGGQQAILQLCGKDGTTAFVNQHGGSQQQESVLATFKVGVLAQ